MARHRISSVTHSDNLWYGALTTDIKRSGWCDVFQCTVTVMMIQQYPGITKAVRTHAPLQHCSLYARERNVVRITSYFPTSVKILSARNLTNVNWVGHLVEKI